MAAIGRVSRNSTAVPGPISPASSTAFQFLSRTQPEEREERRGGGEMAMAGHEPRNLAARLDPVREGE